MKKGNKKKITLKRESKNKLMIAAASIALLAGVYGGGVAMASPSEGGREEVVQMLAERFNLNEEDVESAMSEYRKQHREERQSEMKARLEERLSQAVSDGKITEDQKNLILAKREEMQNKINEEMENWSGDRAERREQMKAYRDEMKQWAEDNGIDTGVIGLGFGGNGNHKGRF